MEVFPSRSKFRQALDEDPASFNPTLRRAAWENVLFLCPLRLVLRQISGFWDHVTIKLMPGVIEGKKCLKALKLLFTV
jgi:hypothetical protein